MRMQRLAIAAACVAATALAACGDAQSNSARDAALTVDGAPVSTAQYDAAVASLRARLEQHTGAAISAKTAAGRRQMEAVEAAAIRDLVAQRVVESMAAADHVSVSDADVAATLQSLQGTAGNPDALIAQLGSSGLSDADVHAAVRALLLQQRLRAADPSGYDAAFAAAVQHARVTVYAAPCTANHAYPACVSGA
jgi:SurA N-terminal domain